MVNKQKFTESNNENNLNKIDTTIVSVHSNKAELFDDKVKKYERKRPQICYG